MNPWDRWQWEGHPCASPSPCGAPVDRSRSDSRPAGTAHVPHGVNTYSRATRFQTWAILIFHARGTLGVGRLGYDGTLAKFCICVHLGVFIVRYLWKATGSTVITRI